MTDALNVFLLDRSGSMSSIKSSTIGNFNTYLTTLKEGGDGLRFTFLQFDTEGIDKVHVNMPIRDVPALTEESFMPRGGTPLIDAIYKTILATGRAVTPATRVCFTILSDGKERDSREYTRAQLHDLIKRKSEEGWQFNYLGASIDAYDDGIKIGLPAGKCMSYDKLSPAMSEAAFRGTARNIRSYAGGQSISTDYSEEQKEDAGDIYAANYDPPVPNAKPAAVTPIVDDLDLSTSS